MVFDFMKNAEVNDRMWATNDGEKSAYAENLHVSMENPTNGVRV